jgi:hypothetical protein
MALFRAFDEHAGPVDMVEGVNLYGSDLDTIAEKLNIE